MERADALIILLDFGQSLGFSAFQAATLYVSSRIHTYTPQSRSHPADCTTLQTTAFFYWLSPFPPPSAGSAKYILTSIAISTNDIPSSFVPEASRQP
jgi:hypothetical protein